MYMFVAPVEFRPEGLGLNEWLPLGPLLPVA